jgi:hypothetical protein
MRIGVVMPLWLQDNPEILDQTARSVACLRSSCHELRVYIACTRLGRGTPADLQAQLAEACAVPLEVLHEPYVERSVAGAWNWGCDHAFLWGAHFVQITANDVEVDSGTTDTLAEFGADPKNANVAIWSGRDSAAPAQEVPYDGCDFSCFMLRRATVAKHGRFDAQFRPAYFEDNDYYARVILGGDEACVVPAARFKHHHSLTIRLEPEAAHHVRHWFEINRQRFAAKWGPSDPPGDRAGVLEKCHPNPWNDPALPLSFCDR